MLNTLTELIAGCEGVSDNGEGTYIVSFPDMTSRLVTESELTLAVELKSRAEIKPVTRRQFKLALLAIGLLDDVEAAVLASSDRSLQINYQEALDFERSNPFVLAMASAMGKTDAEIDGLFILAASL